MKENVLFTALHKRFKPLWWCYVKFNSCFCYQQTVQINHSSKYTGICGLRIRKPTAFQILRACISSMSSYVQASVYSMVSMRVSKRVSKREIVPCCQTQKGHAAINFWIYKVIYFHYIKINIIHFDKNNNLYKKRKLNYQIKHQTGTTHTINLNLNVCVQQGVSPGVSYEPLIWRGWFIPSHITVLGEE